MTTDEEQSASRSARRGARSRRKSADIAARRHQGRMLALQVLYEVDLTDHDPEDAKARAFAAFETDLEEELTAKLETEFAARDQPDHEAEFAAKLDAKVGRIMHGVTNQVNSLVDGVLAARDELDPVIAGAAPARDLAEQAAIERNVLRLAVYELLKAPDVPPKVAINEGVELAKRFGGENSGKFVNGVLRTILERRPRDVEEPAAKNDE